MWQEDKERGRGSTAKLSEEEVGANEAERV